MKVTKDERVLTYINIMKGDCFKFEDSEKTSSEMDGIFMKTNHVTQRDCFLCVNIETGRGFIDIKKDVKIIPVEVEAIVKGG